jgi:hypothetical protein
MSEPLLLINPRHRRKRRKNARRHRSRRRHTNPRYRRRRHRNPRRGFGGMSLSPMSVVRSTILPAAIGGVGAVGLDVALAYLPVPETLKTGVPATLTKLVAAILLGYGFGKVTGKRDMGKLITMGAVTVMGYQFIRDQAKAALPNIKGLGSYMDYVDYTLMQDRGGMGAYMTAPRLNGLGFISPAPVVQGGGNVMGAYMSPEIAPGMNGFNYDSPDGM